MSSPPRFSATTFISSNENALLERMRAAVAEIKGSTSRILYGCPLSCFIHPNHVLVTSPLENDAVYRGVLTASLVRKDKESPLAFAVLDEKSPHAGEVKCLIEKLGVECLIVDIERLLPAQIDEACEGVSRAFAAKVSPISSSKVTNKSEQRAGKIAEFALRLIFPESKFIRTDAFVDQVLNLEIRRAQESYRVFHEIAASRVITIEKKFGENLKNCRILRYLRTTSFDLLIATPPPNSYPLLAIEVDGEVHQEKSKKIRNDRMKNEICGIAGIPLLRVQSVSYPLLWSGNIEGWTDFLAKRPHRFLSFVVRTISKLRLNRVKSRDLESARLQRIFLRFRELESIRVTREPPPSVEERVLLFLQAERDLGIDDARQYEEFVDDANVRADAEGLSAYYMEELCRIGVAVEVQMRWDDDRCSARLSIRDLKEGAAPHEPEEIELPPVRISGIGISLERAWVESFLMEDALRHALERSSSTTTPRIDG